MTDSVVIISPSSGPEIIVEKGLTNVLLAVSIGFVKICGGVNGASHPEKLKAIVTTNIAPNRRIIEYG